MIGVPVPAMIVQVDPARTALPPDQLFVFVTLSARIWLQTHCETCMKLTDINIAPPVSVLLGRVTNWSITPGSVNVVVVFCAIGSCGVVNDPPGFHCQFRMSL